VNLGFRKYFIACIVTAACFPAFIQLLQAQPALNFRSMGVWGDSSGFYIGLEIHPTCNGFLTYSFQHSDFSVQENGRDVQNFTLSCPDSVTKCFISTGLLLDCSTRTTGALQQMQSGLRSFVQCMDAAHDDAQLMSFDSTVYFDTDMTLVHTDLDQAADSLRTGGRPKLWDGLYTALQAFRSNYTNPCGAILLFSSGYDSLSTRTPAAVIKFATGFAVTGIRIFTAGYGADVNDTLLASIAAQTGGEYLGRNPGPAQFLHAYQMIGQSRTDHDDDCTISYPFACLDGSVRTVTLTLKSCGGVSTVTDFYRAPKDTTTYTPVPFTLATVWSKGDTDVVLPLAIAANLNDSLRPFSFKVNFDPACISLKSVDAPPGCYLQGNTLSITPTAAGATITVANSSFIATAGNLALFTFHTSAAGADTVCCPRTITQWQFKAGCYKAAPDTGKIFIIPPPVVFAGALPASRQLSMECYPAPFSAQARISFTLPRDAAVSLELFDAYGRRVREITTARYPGGEHSLTFHPDELPSGMYFLRLEADGKTLTRELLLVR
jgi:hypothetical protein